MSEVILNSKTKQVIDALLKLDVPLVEAYRIMGICSQKQAA